MLLLYQCLQFVGGQFRDVSYIGAIAFCIFDNGFQVIFPSVFLAILLLIFCTDAFLQLLR
ncbi:hypothetical protein BCT30_14915 [Enterovibrio norvegicus]|nr:hypothetical protein A1OS_14970 [Enterovibrio norvegicus]OEF48434.1 hypothetical protein A1OW_15675 [Enterovibrio norvegicus]OEF57873.1 hypothetical protein A1OU_06590 [Enterovibrio norvegicus]PMI32588.1 hypothetical protein BCU47_12350 [Enterovibrio norvegicus]PMI37627.1 hypothetical protein BCU46_11110 [Enterovibrio norvegicus]